MEGRVTAVHGISIAAHPKEYRQRVYGLARDADLSFITCPTAWIDSRRNEWSTPTHNSITPVEEMLKYGLTVAIGSDTSKMSTSHFGWKYIQSSNFCLNAFILYDIDALVDIATKNGDSYWYGGR